MADDMAKGSSPRGGTEPVSGCLVRLAWLAVGNVVLLVLSLTILSEPPWKLTLKDAAFWTVVAALVALRYVDVTHFGGQTANGEPATRRHFARYTAWLVGASALLWTLAQSVQVGA